MRRLQASARRCARSGLGRAAAQVVKEGRVGLGSCVAMSRPVSSARCCGLGPRASERGTLRTACARVVDVLAVVVVPCSLLWVTEAFPRGLDPGKALRRTLDVVGVLVRVLLEGGLAEAVGRRNRLSMCSSWLIVSSSGWKWSSSEPDQPRGRGRELTPF